MRSEAEHRIWIAGIIDREAERRVRRCDSRSSGRFATPDDLVRAALENLSAGSDLYDGIDPVTAAAIDEAEAQYARGEARRVGSGPRGIAGAAH